MWIHLVRLGKVQHEILEEIQNSTENISSDSSRDVIPNKRCKGYFCPDIVCNLKGRVVSESEIKVLKNGLEFCTISKKGKQARIEKGLWRVL